MVGVVVIIILDNLFVYLVVLSLLPAEWLADMQDAVLFYLLQRAGDGVDNEAAHGDVLRDERMGLNGLHGLANRSLGVAEAFQPMVKIDAALTNDIERLILDTTGFHHMVEMAVTHMARTALRMCHHHDFLHAQFVDRHYQAAHRRIKGRNDQPAGILNDLSVAVLQSQYRRKLQG